MANEHLLTQEGFDKLKKELDELRGPKRMEIADAIREAKSHGDLRENAAYHEAKLNQTRLDQRIGELEKLVQIARIVDRPAGKENEAHLGSSVKLHDLEFDDELTIKLVGGFEADPANDLISISSPLGEAVLGKTIGAEVEVNAPGGVQKYKILGIG